MVKIVLVGLLLLVVPAACGGSDSSSAGSGGRREVVVAFYPLAWATEQVAGDSVRVRNLTPPGTEPHDVELTAREVERIRSADVVFYLGDGFQPAVEQAVDGASGETVDLLDHPIGHDPHIWLDPVRFAETVKLIAHVLGRPNGADKPVAMLERLDRDYARGLAHCARRQIVTSHEAFGYLARRYGLQQVPITGLSPEAEPTPRDLQDVVARVERTGATTVFFETLVSPRLAQTVARETGARTAVLNPIEGLTEDQLDGGESYVTVMRENLAALRKALGCR